MVATRKLGARALMSAAVFAASIAGQAVAHEDHHRGISQSGEQRNMRRVGHVDLQGRASYQPNVIVYPDEFIPGWEVEDDAGVIHRHGLPLAGEAMPGGPVVLSWPDVEASADWDAAGMNLVIHEFAHKLDMRNGEANGCPPLPASMPPNIWKKSLTSAYADFRARVERGENTAIDPYAAESPAEFFAVLSEVFFADPTLLLHEYPKVYKQFMWFYKQDPASRTELLLEE